MRKLWTKEELELVEELYKSGLNAEDTYRKFSEIFIGRTLASIILVIKRKKFKHTPEQSFKLRSVVRIGDKNPMYGKPGPNLDLTKDDSDRMRNASIKMAATRKDLFSKGVLDVSGEKNGMYGKKPWNLGLSTETSDILKQAGEKTSVYHKERWQNYTQDEKDFVIGRMTEAANKIKKNSSIEIKVEKILLEENICFIKQYRKSKFVFDFFIKDSNLVIECQGDYWHANPRKYNSKNLNEIQKNNIERDGRKKDFLNQNNFSSLFFWEYDIHKNIDKVRESILRVCK